MISKIVEVTNGFNWGKVLVAKFDAEEWAYRSKIERPREMGGGGFSRLLPALGWDDRHRWVLDLQTGEGAFFLPTGYAEADLDKHQVWVCPLYPLFLEWFYKHKEYHDDILTLPALVELMDEKSVRASTFYGYRRPGPDAATRARKSKETEIE
jgi:hypothetical protein